jgi:Ca2+-binding RTX toxin-like protein
VLGNFKFATDANGGTIIYDPPVQDQNAAQVVNGTIGNDTLMTSAANQTFSGLGGNDTFVFRPNFGHDIITDFKPSLDKIDIDHALFADLNAVLSSATTSGSDTVIHDIAGDTITLKNTALTSLHTNDFHLI